MVGDRGREADSPLEIPVLGWRDIAWRVWLEFNDDRLLLFSAGAVFYLLLSLIPSLTALLAIYGLAFDVTSVGEHVGSMLRWASPEVRSILEEQLTLLTATNSSALGIGFLVSLFVALWSASSATKAMIDGLNIVYDETEKRSFLKLNLIALAFTLCALIGVALIIGAASMLGRQQSLLPIVMVIAFIWAALVAFYRWAPSRRQAKWRWVMPGTLVALALIALSTAGFGWYAKNFAGYSASGSLGSVIAFMTYAWLAVLSVLLGAEINAEIEHQTQKDSTVGASKPMGMRGAKMADTVGMSSDEAAAQPVASPLPGRDGLCTTRPTAINPNGVLAGFAFGFALALLMAGEHAHKRRLLDSGQGGIVHRSLRGRPS